MVNKKNKLPLYLQLMEDIIKKIEQGDYSENEKLPSERELCDIYNLSRITVRNALQELEQEEYIYKLHGKGTFVAPKSYKQKLVKVYSFTEEMKKLGKVPQTKVLSFDIVPIDQRLSLKMHLDVDQEVYRVKRLRLADNVPFICETSYLPTHLFPNLTKQALEERPMYSVFMDDYNMGVSQATEQFSVTSLRSEEAENLHAEIGSPAMLLERLAYDNATLIEYTVSIISGNKFKYTVELN
ncbi:GntR family transcriptional regulator [Halolactibacillus miurensis]|uniref:GntR family transcriptional regulator n=1 Tax=Halolactibacillus miurensis TaxID=306541 RepID=A0A1I6P5B1_9BACI|nr:MULTISPECIES: GntR family transcriptional regulator [Halolactibacillus]GEM03111.1 GntR family transcriptional regulator [Halolactibacillus miurensis]SFS35367.1 GntR family transcriptional regulator [Halolactibacillus miurensis]